MGPPTVEKLAELEQMTASERVKRDDRLDALVGQSLPDGPYPWFDSSKNMWARVHIINPQKVPRYCMRPDGNLTCGWPPVSDGYVDVLLLYLWYDVDAKTITQSS